MKSSKIFAKRSTSPFEAPRTTQISSNKKKSTSNAQLSSQQAKKALKQFDSYGKTQKKRNNYLKQLLKNNNEQTNKYRIVTEPVEQKLLYLGNNNFSNNAPVIKLPANSKSKLQTHHHQYSQKFLKLNIRTSQHSKDKLASGQSLNKSQPCRNCQKYRQQLQQVKKELSKICMDKILWKSGQMHIDDVKQSFFNLSKIKTINQTTLNSAAKPTINSINSTQNRSNSNQMKNKYTHVEYKNNTNHKGSNEKIRSPSQIKQQRNIITTLTVDKQLGQIKKHLIDLMNDIQSLSAIDYPKMLSLNIFKYDPFYVQSPSAQQHELKQLLGQLRNSLEGKITDDDFEQLAGEMNEHNKMIMRNLKNRLNHYLRENLQLKMKKQVLERSQEITQQSVDYLRKVVEDVLLSYSDNLVHSLDM